MPKQCFKAIASTQQLGNRSNRTTSEPGTAGGQRKACPCRRPRTPALNLVTPPVKAGRHWEPPKHKQAARPGTCRLLGWEIFAVLLDGADLLCQPGCPFLDALALGCGDGEDGGLRVELAHAGVERLAIEVEHGHGVHLVQDDHLRRLEDAGILERLVIAFGHGQDHDLGVLAQIEVGRAHQVAHVLHDDQVQALQVEHVDGAADHVVNLRSSGNVW